MAAYRLPALVARSFLFVPGIELGKLERAWSRGADVVVVDLEDSVPSGRKAEARSVTVERLGRLDGRDRGRTWVRVNNEPGLLEADLASVPRRGAAGVLVPKVPSAESAEALRSAVDRTIGSEVGFIPMIESAEAVLDVQKIAGVRGVTTLMLGEYDLAADDLWATLRPTLQLVHDLVSTAEQPLANPPATPSDYRTLGNLLDYCDDMSNAAMARVGSGGGAA